MDSCPECGSKEIGYTPKGNTRTFMHKGACSLRGRVCEAVLNNDGYWSRHKTYCCKPVKGTGKGQFDKEELFLCGLHLSVIRRAERKQEALNMDRQMQEWLRDETTVMMQRIFHELGIRSHMEYDRDRGRYTGKIVINPADLVAILDEEEE